MLSYNIIGEHNRARHADYVCATFADTQIKRRTTTHDDFNHTRSSNWNARPCILTIGGRHFAAATHNAAHAPNGSNFVTMRHLGLTPAKIGQDGHFCVWVREATTGGSDSYRRSMLTAVEQAYEMAKSLGYIGEHVSEVEEMLFRTIRDIEDPWLRGEAQRLMEEDVILGTGEIDDGEQVINVTEIMVRTIVAAGRQTENLLKTFNN